MSRFSETGASSEGGSSEAPAKEGTDATFGVSVLYAVADLRQLARAAPPDKAEVIEAVADLLAGLAAAND